MQLWRRPQNVSRANRRAIGRCHGGANTLPVQNTPESHTSTPHALGHTPAHGKLHFKFSHTCTFATTTLASTKLRPNSPSHGAPCGSRQLPRGFQQTTNGRLSTIRRNTHTAVAAKQNNYAELLLLNSRPLLHLIVYDSISRRGFWPLVQAPRTVR